MLIIGLLLAVLVEGIAIASKLSNDPATNAGDGGAGSDGASPTIELACEVISPIGVNLREGPSTQFNRKVTLPPAERLTATGRSGDVPWLFVRLGDGRDGWASSRDEANETLVRCTGDLLSLPEVGPALAEADTPEQLAATPAPTLTARPTLTAAPNIRLRQGNGPDLHAARRSFALTLDGALSEWGDTSAASIGTPVFQAENWAGPQDLNGVVRAAWDDEFLYLALQVEDDVIVQESKEDLLHRGDALEVFWDGDLARDFEDDTPNADDSQMVVSAGNFGSSAPAAWVYQSPGGNFRSQVTIAAQQSATGYTMELRLPWSGFGVVPRSSAIFGYALALSDDDSPGSGEQETQLSTTPQAPFRHPTRWGNFVLDP